MVAERPAEPWSSGGHQALAAGCQRHLVRRVDFVDGDVRHPLARRSGGGGRVAADAGAVVADHRVRFGAAHGHGFAVPAEQGFVERTRLDDVVRDVLEPDELSRGCGHGSPPRRSRRRFDEVPQAKSSSAARRALAGENATLPRTLAARSARGLRPRPMPEHHCSAAAPVAPREPRDVSVHGDHRIDDYFWLRDRDDPRTLAYLRAENAYADAWFAAHAELKERPLSGDAVARSARRRLGALPQGATGGIRRERSPASSTRAISGAAPSAPSAASIRPAATRRCST